MKNANEKGQPVPGQWAKQQKKGMEKQQQGGQQQQAENKQTGQQGGAGEPQTTGRHRRPVAVRVSRLFLSVPSAPVRPRRDAAARRRSPCLGR